MMSMAIMLLIVGVVSSIYFASLHVWRRCSSQSQADPPAHMSLDRITSELKNAYMVNSPDTATNYITVTLPARDSTGTNIYPFQPATRVTYYLSDASGQRDRTGTYLWREKVRVSDGNTTRNSIAGNVENLSFEVYPSGSGRVLKVYAMSIAVVGRERHEEYVSRFSGSVAFRN
jgi:hypothetical protein